MRNWLRKPNKLITCGFTQQVKLGLLLSINRLYNSKEENRMKNTIPEGDNHSKLAFISHPLYNYDDDIMKQNVHTAMMMGEQLIRNGYAVYVPHANIGWLYGKIKESTAMEINHTILKRCHIIVFGGDWKSSSGCQQEYKWAKKYGLKIYFMNV